MIRKHVPAAASRQTSNLDEDDPPSVRSAAGVLSAGRGYARRPCADSYPRGGSRGNASSRQAGRPTATYGRHARRATTVPENTFPPSRSHIVLIWCVLLFSRGACVPTCRVSIRRGRGGGRGRQAAAPSRFVLVEASMDGRQARKRDY